MQKVRKRRSFSNQVKFADGEEKPQQVEGNRQHEKEKPAQRLGNYVRYGNTVFELHEDKGDSIYCTILEVGVVIIILQKQCHRSLKYRGCSRIPLDIFETNLGEQT